MIELICIKLKFFQKFGYYLVLAFQYQVKDIHPLNCSIFRNIDFPKRNEKESAGFEQSPYEPTICRFPLIRDGSAIFNY
jgi:hypothetical protein